MRRLVLRPAPMLYSDFTEELLEGGGMPDMPEIVTQMEQASGLPWWCLLLLAVLVLAIVLLVIALGRERSRAKVAAVNIPKAPARGLDPLGAEEPTDEPAEAEEKAESSVSENEPDSPAPSEGSVETLSENAPEPAEEEPEAEATAPESEMLHDEVEPTASQTVPDESEAAAPQTVPDELDAAAFQTVPDESEAAAPVAEESAEPATPAPVDNAVPETMVLKKGYAPIDFNLDDDQIIKATGGSHSRVGQSPFGVDFGFLEEYEEEYERALAEFQRLRGKTERD